MKRMGGGRWRNDAQPREAHRKRKRAAVILAAALLAAAALSSPVRAILVMRDPGRNTSPPTGAFADAGWQYEGDWHHFPGTVVGPHHFLTAAHTGGLPLQVFRFRGKDYYALDKTLMPGTDIALWRVAGTFPDWATLYAGDQEVGKNVFVCGRGGPRGEPLIVHGKRAGWFWSEQDGAMSWGRNRITGIGPGFSGPGKQVGPILTFQFDKASSGAGDDTASFTGGDSGGGVFLHDSDGKWRLAGIVFGVDRSYYRGPEDKDDIAAAIYDARGLYRTTPEGHFYIDPDGPYRVPTTCLVSRLSPYTKYLKGCMLGPPRWKLYLLWCGLCLGLPFLLGGSAAYFFRRSSHRRWLREKRLDQKSEQDVEKEVGE